jgi:hypothetical protein
MQLTNGSWNPALISAMAAIFGSLVGAMGSSLSSWIAQRQEGRRDLLAKKIFHREQLYADFIRESAKLVVDAAQNEFEDPKSLIPMYALASRIRLSSSTSVIESAERVIKAVLHAYSGPNLTPEEIHALVDKGEDPLRDFSKICRHELESLWHGM